MFNLFKKTATLFGKGFLYSLAFAICPLILIGYLCCGDDSRHGSHGTGAFLQCCGCLLGLPALVLTGITLPLGLASAALCLAGGLIICPLAAVADCFSAATSCCTGDDRHAHPRHDIENPPPAAEHHEEIAHAVSSHAVVRSALNNDHRPAEENTTKLDAFSKYTQDYVDSFNRKTSHTQMIEALKLNEEEMKQLDSFVDPIMGTVMDIPVILNERVYNLLTLQEILARDGKDPFTKLEFTLRDIQPARSVEEQIKNKLKQIEENRKNPESAPEKSPGRKNSSEDVPVAPKMAA